MHVSVGLSTWSMDDQTEDTSLKKYLSPFPSNYQLLMAPQLGLQLLEHSISHGGMLIAFTFCRSCTGNNSCCEFMIAKALLYPKGTVLQKSSPITDNYTFNIFSQCSPRLMGVHGGVLYRHYIYA